MSDIDTIAKNVDLLVRGWRERVEYVERVKYHAITCKYTAPQCELCDCKEEPETRVRHVQQPGLLGQLKDYVQNRDADLNPKPARGAPRVKKAKLNPELNGFLTLDEISCDIYMSLDQIFEEGQRDRTWLSTSLNVILMGLPDQMRHLEEDGHPDLIRRTRQLTDKWVAQARRTLNHSVSDAMFADTVCGNCSGGLAAPARVEGEAAVVRCIGTPTEPPCGETYPASEWLALYEGRKR